MRVKTLTLTLTRTLTRTLTPMTMPMPLTLTNRVARVLVLARRMLHSLHQCLPKTS